MSLRAGGLANKVRLDWRRRDPWAIKALVMSLVVGVTFSALALIERVGRPDPPEPRPLEHAVAAAGGVPPPPPAVRRPEASILGVDVHVNERAGYLVSFPSDWRLDERSGPDELVDPTGSSMLSFSQVPSGPLPGAVEVAMENLSPPNASISIVTRTFERTEQGQAGLVVGGTATEADGTSVQFMAIAIRGAARNYTITARFPSTVTARFVDDVEQIIGSFRTTVLDV